MSLGFNSNVRLGGTVYHVQTEERGSDHPFIDTTVYASGRVLHRRTTSYHDLLGSDKADRAALQQRVEKQHSAVIEELRAGTLALEAETPPSKKIPRPGKPGIEVQLLNFSSWLIAGAANLQIEVRVRKTNKPAAGVLVEAALEGAQEPSRFEVRANERGYATLNFPLPKIGHGDATLVIRASGLLGRDEIRYRLKPKGRASKPQAVK